MHRQIFHREMPLLKAKQMMVKCGNLRTTLVKRGYFRDILVYWAESSMSIFFSVKHSEKKSLTSDLKPIKRYLAKFSIF